MILTIRTENPHAELGLYDGNTESAYVKWNADRSLSAEIHKKLDELLRRANAGFSDLDGLVLYKGPGSFTGLRIGASVANTLASELDIPIAGANGEDWIREGLESLKADPRSRLIVPEYGSEPKTTKPKK